MSGSRVDLKVVLLGKEYGGKTSLVERYLHDRFHGDVPYQNTIGAAFGAKKVDVYDRTVTMGVWDTAGSERYEAMSRIYYRGAKAAIVCYDLTDELSFGKARFWVEELLKNEEVNAKLVTYPNQMTTELWKKQISEIRAQVFETSSKTGHNIKDLFFKIAKDFVDDPKNNENGEETPNTLKLSENSHKKSCPC
eukprot:XP_011668163.1 PREDICTED: ras-related protein Rab-24 [Strongylocentrotus purpuratus]